MSLITARRNLAEARRRGDYCYLSLFASTHKSINEDSEGAKERRTAFSLLRLFVTSFIQFTLYMQFSVNSVSSVVKSSSSFVVLRSLRYFVAFANAVSSRHLDKASGAA